MTNEWRPLIVLLGCVSTIAQAEITQGPTVRSDGTLVRAGKPWRGVGVNYFDAFARTLSRKDDRTFEEGFKLLQQAGIPFARIEACGFWPNDNRLYLENPAEYIRRLDAVVQSAGRHNVGLILSLFWNPGTVPDTVGEPVSAWGDTTSKTRAFMRKYVREIVGRYKSKMVVWGYEFGNEYNLGASLPNAKDHRAMVAPQLGTPASRTENDEWTYETIRSAFAEFGREVRKNDRRCLLVTGDAFPRESAWHNWKERTWARDTPDQFAEMLRDNNPDPIDTLSVHAYGDSTDRIQQSNRIAKVLRKPLFVGEFGAPGDSEKSRREFDTLLKAIESQRVPLAALWVFDYHGQDGEWNVTASNTRAWQLQALSEANRRMKASMIAGQGVLKGALYIRQWVDAPSQLSVYYGR